MLLTHPLLPVFALVYIPTTASSRFVLILTSISERTTCQTSLIFSPVTTHVIKPGHTELHTVYFSSSFPESFGAAADRRIFRVL